MLTVANINTSRHTHNSWTYHRGPVTREKLDPVRAIRDFGDLVNEVATHLGNADGANVTITVEINTESGGLDDCTSRTVSENAAQLRFDSHEFEE